MRNMTSWIHTYLIRVFKLNTLTNSNRHLRRIRFRQGLLVSGGGGRGSSAVERATPGEEVPGSIPAVAARSLQVGSVSV